MMTNKMNNFDDEDTLKQIDDIFHSKQTRSFELPGPNEPVVLLLSGGMDSLGLWFMLTHKYKLQVYPIIFYPNKSLNSGQWKAIAYMTNLISKRFPNQFHKPHKIKLARGFSYSDIKINEKELLSLIVRNLSTTDVAGTKAVVTNNPTRLFDYISKTIGYIQKWKLQRNIDIKFIFIGFVPEDAEISRESTLSVIRSINLTLSLIFGDYSYRLFAPLDKKNGFFYKKSDILRYAINNNVEIEKSWSCMKSGNIHCGLCPSCKSRKLAFKHAGHRDKTRYIHPYGDITAIPQKVIRQTIAKIQNRFRIKPNIAKTNFTIIKMQLFIHPDVIWNSVDGKVYRLHKTSGILDSLNDVGGFIWRCIANSSAVTIQELIVMVKKEYYINNKKEEKVITKDISAFITDAIEKSYIGFKKKNMK